VLEYLVGVEGDDSTLAFVNRGAIHREVFCRTRVGVMASKTKLIYSVKVNSDAPAHITFANFIKRFIKYDPPNDRIGISGSAKCINGP
jgi:hypothetical protein